MASLDDPKEGRPAPIYILDGTTYEVLRGDLDGLPVGTGVGETCLGPGSTDTSLVDSETPADGAGYYYLVRGSNPCGTGGYGTDSEGLPRDSATCP